MNALLNTITTELPAAIFSLLNSQLIPALLILIVGMLVISVIMKVLNDILNRSKLEKAAHSLIKSLAKTVMYILLALIVADKLGIDVTGIIALASVLTLAVSLAVQNALSNVIGGFTLLYTQPFHSGDFVEIAGQSGTVNEIGLTYTKLATADNKLVSIPNSAVTAAQIINYTATGTRRIDVNVSASYTMPVEKVIAALKEAAAVPTALNKPAPFAAVQSYGESTIVYVLQVWTSADDYWTTLFDVNNNVKATFERNNIAMSYPHLNIHMEK